MSECNVERKTYKKPEIKVYNDFINYRIFHQLYLIIEINQYFQGFMNNK